MTLSYRESRWNRPQFQAPPWLLRTPPSAASQPHFQISLESNPRFAWMAFGFALASNQGLAAIAMLLAASMSAELPMQGDGTTPAGRQFTTLLIAGLLIAAWYCCRRLRTTSG